MNRDEADTAESVESVFESVVLAFDEALATGSSPAPLKTQGVPAELVPRLLSARHCLGLLERARQERERSWAEPTSRRPGPSAVGAGEPLPAVNGNVGRFEIEDELGRGGNGVVFLARDPALNRRVALKLPRPETLLTPELTRRFIREAQAAGSLDHPNLVAVYEVGEDGPLLYIASAFCEGPTLAKWLRRDGPVPVRDAMRIVADLADGVAEAHRQGILHRDIKPGNVLLEPRAANGSTTESFPFTPKLTDFGLAKLADFDPDATRTGVLLGTPSYMAPEQAAGRINEVGPATDVYGLGAVLYELLTGERVFQGASDIDTLRQVIDAEPLPPRQRRAEVPADLQAVCLKCLEKNPAHRYGSSAGLAVDLRRCLAGEPTLARPLRWPQRLSRWARRRPTAAALAVLSVLSAVTLIAVLSWHSVTLTAALAETSRQRDAAEELRKIADENGHRASTQERIANQYLYAARMRLVDEAIRQGEAREATDSLKLYEGDSKFADLRGFEWYYLARSLHSEKRMLTAHGEPYTVAFSPDGKVLASGGEDGTIAFWDPATGAKRHEFVAHQSCVNEIAYSPDGRLLASGGCDNTVRVWDVESSRELTQLIHHDDWFQSVRFSPDGRWLAAIANQGLFVIWKVETWELVHRGGIGHTASWLEWSPDGTTLATGSHYYAQLWEVGTWRELHRAEVKSLTGIYCEDSRSLILNDGSSLLYWVPGKPVASISVPLTEMNGLILVANASGGQLALAGYGEQVVICDANGLPSGLLQNRYDISESTRLLPKQAAPVPIRRYFGHTGTVKDVAFSPDNTLLATASRDGTVRLWDPTRAGESVPVLRLKLAIDPWPYLDQVATNADLTRLFVMRQEPRQLEAWDISDAAHVQLLQSKPIDDQSSFRLAVGNDVQSVTLLSREKTPKLSRWDFETNELDLLREIKGDVHQANFSADGSVVAYQTTDANVHIHDLRANRQELELVRTHQDPRHILGSTRLMISPRGDRVLVSASDLFDLEQQQSEAITVESYDTGLVSGKFSADGRLVAIASNGFTVFDSRTFEEICRRRSPLLSEALAFSADGRSLAGTDERGFVKLWNTFTAREMLALETAQGTLIHVQFSRDNKRLAALVRRDDTEECELYLWSVETQ